MDNVEKVRQLQQLTQAGLLDCKRSLEESGWDFEKAVDILKTKGLNVLSGRENKVAAEGVLMLSTKDNFATLVEVNCQTDFCAKSKNFQSFATLASFFLTDAMDRNTKFDHTLPILDFARKESMSINKENIVVRRWWIEESLTPEAKVFSYLHSNNKLGVLLTLSSSNLETLKDPMFLQLGNNLAMQIAAMNPLAVSSSRLSPEVVSRQKDIFMAQLEELKKPKTSWDKILNGKLNKWFSEVCLLEQEDVLATKTKVSQTIDNVSNSLNTKITVVNFTRAEVGEGLEPEKKDFVSEVANLAGVKFDNDFESLHSLLR